MSATSRTRNCGCGLYAWHPSAARTAYSLPRGEDEGGCTGIVEAWGRVQLHREGFRTRYARPTVLILPRAAVGTGHEATIRRLAAAHRAEVAVVGRAGDLERYCRERDLGLSPAAVGDLLGEEPDPPAEESSGVSTPAKLSSSLAEMVLTGFFGLLALLWYGFLAVAAVSVLLAIVNGSSEGDGERARVPPPADHLEIVDTRIGQKAGGILYATRVRNADERSAALGVGLDGRLVTADGQTLARLDAARTDQLRATIGPGHTGLILGSVETTPAREARLRAGAGSLALRDAKLRRRADVAIEPRRLPMVSEARLDRRACLITARVAGPRSLIAADVDMLALRQSRPRWLAESTAGPFAPHPVRQALYRVPPGWCGSADIKHVDLEIYPDLSREQIEALADP